MKTPIVRTPEEVAEALGKISVGTLIALLKSRGYHYTELKPGATPWGRGRQCWGMTDEQIAAVIAGQTRKHPRPTEVSGEVGSPVTPIPGLAAVGHDGKSRLRRRVKA